MTFKKIDHDDAARPQGKTCILVFGYDPLEFNLIKAYANSLNNIEAIEIKSNATYNTLQQLINGTGNISKQVATHKSPAIVLNAVSQLELNQFVHEFKTLNLKRPLFAMVTETSINWRFHDLVDDLLEERAMFMKMEQEKNK